jgi:uncharacterized protein (TIGR03790 family)
MLALGAQALTGAQVLIVYNDQDPDSRSLAEYYAAKRAVPTNQICRISVRAHETITRKEFREEIRKPILDFLTSTGLLRQEPVTRQDPVFDSVPGFATTANRIGCVVLMRGVPLRIDPDPTVNEGSATNGLPKTLLRNEAAVDSELTLLPVEGAPVTGPLRNPYFGSAALEFGPPWNRQMVLVGRLDGPEPATVRRMIDDALAAERYGLHGRGYFDLRAATEAGYIRGDTWIRESYRLFREAGYECDIDERPELYEEDYPMSDVAVYAGWYAQDVTGPFKRPAFRFQTGAMAYHLHSFSAASVRSKTSYWVGPLSDKGATATIGHVFEPYLAMTPELDAFFRRLLAGMTFIEAGYASQPVLSWQTTFVGDPLYRPFAVSLDEQIRRLEADGRPELEWAYLRKVNLSGGEGFCREKAKALNSAVLYEKLGDLTGDANACRQALRPAGDPYRYLRVANKLAEVYVRNRQPREALALYESLTVAFATRKNALALNRKAHELAIAAGETAKAEMFQARIDELEKKLKETK